MPDNNFIIAYFHTYGTELAYINDGFQAMFEITASIVNGIVIYREHWLWRIRCLATVAMGHGLEIGTPPFSIPWSIIVPSFMLLSPTEQFQPCSSPVA